MMPTRNLRIRWFDRDFMLVERYVYPHLIAQCIGTSVEHCEQIIAAEMTLWSLAGARPATAVPLTFTTTMLGHSRPELSGGTYALLTSI